MASLALESYPEVRFTMSNRWTSFECESDAQDSLRRFFRYKIPGAHFSAAYRCGQWDGYKNLASRGRVPTGLLLEMLPEVKKAFHVAVKDNRRCPKFRELETSDKDRPYQTQAVNAMIEAARTGGLVLAATGVGKTHLGAIFFQRLIGPACFIVDELVLLEQSRIEIEALLKEKVGVVGRSEFNPQRITVATIQTLARHRRKRSFQKWFGSLEVLIIDEIHLALNKRNIDIVTSIKPIAVFGLTATLQMEKPEVRLPATALAGPIIFTYPIQEGVKQGYLSAGVVVCLEFHDPLPKGKAPGYWSTLKGKKIWIESGSTEAEYRYRVVLNKARNDCVESLVREGLRRGKRIVVLAERVAHLGILSKRFADVPHAVASGAVKSVVRLQAMRDMDAGKLSLILASRVFSKGVNVKTVDCIIDATALPGRNSAIQRYGRGVRTAEGKVSLLYIDISDWGKFSYTSKQRKAALRETGATIIDCVWKGNAESALGIIS